MFKKISPESQSDLIWALVVSLVVLAATVVASINTGTRIPASLLYAVYSGAIGLAAGRLGATIARRNGNQPASEDTTDAIKATQDAIEAVHALQDQPLKPGVKIADTPGE